MDNAENQYYSINRYENFYEKINRYCKNCHLFAVMLTIHFVTSFILEFVPSGIQPTLVHIPVVIASVIYGPRIGAVLGLLMGLFSVTMNTLVLTPASFPVPLSHMEISILSLLHCFHVF